MRYRFVPHTGDAKFQAFGETLEEAFANAALALASLMWDWKKVQKNRKIPVEIEGKDLSQLLVNFLEEILFLFDSKMFLLSSVERMHIEQNERENRLTADLIGDAYSPQYSTFGEVKAVTYHELKIRKSHHFFVQVVVDV